MYQSLLLLDLVQDSQSGIQTPFKIKERHRTRAVSIGFQAPCQLYSTLLNINLFYCQSILDKSLFETCGMQACSSDVQVIGVQGAQIEEGIVGLFELSKQLSD